MGNLQTPPAARLDKGLDTTLDLGSGPGHRSPSSNSYSLRFKNYYAISRGFNNSSAPSVFSRPAGRSAQISPSEVPGIPVACSILSLLAAVPFETITLPALRAATLPILYSGIFSAGVAFTLQVICQRTSPPAHAAIVMSLETVFAALSGYLILHERLTPRDLAGCTLMFAALIVVQLPLLLGPKPRLRSSR
jgi:drug/metabolite transporter (DMT)-like permease